LADRSVDAPAGQDIQSRNDDGPGWAKLNRIIRGIIIIRVCVLHRSCVLERSRAPIVGSIDPPSTSGDDDNDRVRDAANFRVHGSTPSM
jgi:hypothetical protein